MSHGQLKEDFGDIADTECAKAVLAGTYQFPKDIDRPTRLLLAEEMTRMAKLFDKDEDDGGEITLDEYVSYWKTEDEKKSSSYSGRHVGHYKAIVEDVHLSSLHAASMNLAVKRGIPLGRWKKAVTTLLEKEAGNCYIEKLRAICLAEKDFNSILKIYYARRMVELMRKLDVIPVEQIATKGKTAIDGVMQKQFFYDQSNITHVDASLSSTDAANCYDAVNHPVCSLALQAVQVPMAAIATYLLSLQTMTFFLKTGFGMAKEGYGGTADNPFMGLTQGSCASPPVWTAVSTVIVRAYKQEGHGVEVRTVWTGLLVAIVAILFVDDTDLLHRRKLRGETREDFVRRVNAARYLWAELLQATGGNLKPPKCYYYLLLYDFHQGRPFLKSLEACSHFPPLQIPQHSGPDVAIEMKDVKEATITLGVYTNPSSDSRAQLDRIMEKAYEWADKVGESSLSQGECYQSFVSQALPQARYGLIPLLEPPAVVEESFLKIYYQVLPKLGVNRNISVDFRWLPWQYQGLGLPNLGLDKASMMIQFINRHWNCKTGIGIQMRRTFEPTQMETGLAGNFLNRDFRQLGCLATWTWFKMVWQYLYYYRIRMELDNVDVPPVREWDEPLMERVVRDIDQSFWHSVNRVRKFKNIYFLSQALCVDGKKVHPHVLDRSEGIASTLEFPLERPTENDFASWRQVLSMITSPTMEFSPPLGRYLRSSYDYDKIQWYSNFDDSELLFKEDTTTGLVTTFSRTPNSRRTRTNERWARTGNTLVGPVRASTRVSVVTITQDIVQTVATLYSMPVTKDNTDDLLTPVQRLHSLSNATLWHHIDIEEEGAWITITEALVDGSLVLVHGGSFMPKLSPEVCSMALIIFCKIRGKLDTVSVAEKTDHQTASNYRGEALGGILGGLVFWAATIYKRKYMDTRINCDNLGVVSKINSKWRSWPENQVHVDVLQCTRDILDELPLMVIYNHIYGHQDDSTPFDELPLVAQLNVLADNLAKQRLEEAVEEDMYISSKFPFESTRTFVGTKKVTSSVKGALYEAWGRRIAREVFIHKGILKPKSFNLVKWDAVGEATKFFPQGFRLWITKQVSHFAGHNKMLSTIDPSQDSTCPCCGIAEESIEHISQCTNEGRTQMFNESVSDLIDFCEDSDMDDELIDGLEQYLLNRGKESLSDLIDSDNPEIVWYLKEHDELGWSNFLEGTISTTLFALQNRALLDNGSSTNIRSWSRKFILLILQITHRQWLFRNAKVHLKKAEGRTETEHKRVIKEVKKMMLVDPSELLPRHQQLLHQDFEALGKGSTSGRIHWLNEMDSAIAAKRSVSTGQSTEQNKANEVERSFTSRAELPGYQRGSHRLPAKFGYPRRSAS